VIVPTFLRALAEVYPDATVDGASVWVRDA
jgi:hypothetical protein